MNKATGSIWNPNSWHWENKNYTKEATEYINKKILDHRFKKDDITFIFTDIKKLNVNIFMKKSKNSGRSRDLYSKRKTNNLL